MVELPFEIWWKILNELPDAAHASMDLRTVNRTFLEIARRMQFHDLHLVSYTKRTKRLLQGINTFSLGHHVQILHIQPWTVSDAPRKGYHSHRVSTVVDHVHSFFDSDFPTRRAKTLIDKRISKAIGLVSETAAKLECVRELRIWWDEEDRQEYHRIFFTAFLSLANADIFPFGRILTKLSLKVPTDRLICLAPVRLPALEELDFHLCTESLLEEYISDCLDSFVVFVDNLSPTLRSLAVSSTCTSQNLNLHRFFHCLGLFPHLRSIALSIPYDGAHLSSPDTLQKFINKHHQVLQELKLSCTRSCPRALPIDPDSKYWIQRTITDLARGAFSLRSLHTIEIALRPQRTDLKPFTDFLHSIANQLESLVLTDDALTCGEVERILDCIVISDSPWTRTRARSDRRRDRDRDSNSNSRLQYLSVRLQCMSPDVIDLLASRLCSLRSLRLAFSDVRYTGADKPQVYSSAEELAFLYHHGLATVYQLETVFVGTIRVGKQTVEVGDWHETDLPPLRPDSKYS